LAGTTLGSLARASGIVAPLDLRRAKGFTGTLLERALGATATSRAAPDFEQIGVELKTLPVSDSGQPLESTFVCTIPLVEMAEVEWEASRVRRKLSRVLWVPIQGNRKLAVAERRIGSPFLWSPTDLDEAALRFDWEELVGYIGRGAVDSITGHLGKYLQVRPKAASSRARRRGLDGDGTSYAALPRGFYLRATFTAKILREQFDLPENRRA
jgi:DNA mismatch repair protein MutH